MRLLKLAVTTAVLGISVGVASAASADIYQLNLSEAQAGLAIPYGQVEVTQDGVNQLKFVVTLFDGLTFIDAGAAHRAFSFSLNSPPASLTFAGPAGFGFEGSDGANLQNSPFSGFDYGVTCGAPACGPGGSSSYAGPLTFTVNGTGLTLSMLGTADSYNGNVVRFAADTLAPGGATGTVGGGTLVGGPRDGGVPEPATWAMLIVGFGMVGAGLRIRRRGAMLAT